MASTTMRRVVIAGAITWFEMPAGDRAAAGTASDDDRDAGFPRGVDGRALTPVLVLPDDGIGSIARMFEMESGGDGPEPRARG